jgi:hypothetical protein
LAMAETRLSDAVRNQPFLYNLNVL